MSKFCNGQKVKVVGNELIKSVDKDGYEFVTPMHYFPTEHIGNVVRQSSNLYLVKNSKHEQWIPGEFLMGV